jgi:hypothetical protein
MLDEGLTHEDGVTIARSVRCVARHARRVLDHPADQTAAREFLDEIERLERQIEPGTSRDLGRWLASLRRRVEGGVTTAV